MHLLMLSFVQSVLTGHHLATTLVHSVRPTPWKDWPIRLNSVELSSFLDSEDQVKIFNLKSRSVNARKYLGPNCAWLGVMCPLISFVPFLDTSRLFHAFFNKLVRHAISTKRSPASVPIELGCLLSLDEILHCQNLGCLHAWVLIASLLDHAGLSDLSKGLL